MRCNSLLFQQRHSGFDLRVMRFDRQRDSHFVDHFIGNQPRQFFDRPKIRRTLKSRVRVNRIAVDEADNFVSQVLSSPEMRREALPALAASDDYQVL